MEKLVRLRTWMRLRHWALAHRRYKNDPLPSPGQPHTTSGLHLWYQRHIWAWRKYQPCSRRAYVRWLSVCPSNRKYKEYKADLPRPWLRSRIFRLRWGARAFRDTSDHAPLPSGPHARSVLRRSHSPLTDSVWALHPLYVWVQRLCHCCNFHPL